MSLGDVVLIEWIDSGLATDMGWAKLLTYQSEINIGKMSVKTVGFFMFEDDETITVGQSWAPDVENWVGAETIAKKCVLKTVVLA